MKTLILNGSPRKNGDTAALLGALTEALSGEVMRVDAYRADIAPCIDCRACWKQPGCAIRDGMQAVYAFLEQADNVVVASPVYFSMLTGPILSVASRFQTLYAAWRFRGQEKRPHTRRGVLILTGGGDTSARGLERTVTTADGLFHQMRADRIYDVYSLRTDDVPAARDEEALAGVREAARLLNAGREGLR